MYEIYKIMENDTLESIIKDYDTTIDTILKINGFSTDYKLIPGNNIIVPANKPYKYYTVKKEDNIYQIAKNNNIDYNLLLKINGLEKDDYIYPNQTILIPKENFKYYLTKNNDTIRNVTNNLNTTFDNIMKENPNIILATDQIIIFKEK